MHIIFEMYTGPPEDMDDGEWLRAVVPNEAWISEIVEEKKVVKEERMAREKKVDEEKKVEGIKLKRKLDWEIKICERYNEDDANITIISSNGVSFKVHSFILLRASSVFSLPWVHDLMTRSVFKNMVGIAQTGSQRGPLELTDEFVEHSQVIEATLDILYNSEIKSFKDDKLYHQVIEFARKYEMPTILKSISNQLRVHATSPDKAHALRLLRVAIDLGECELITAIVRATCGHVWPDDPKAGLFSVGILEKQGKEKKQPWVPPQLRDTGSIFPQKILSLPPPNVSTKAKEYIQGGKAFDLGSWPYPEFAALPTPLAWALLRADQLAAKEYSVARTEAFGRELQNVLDSMCESSCPQDQNQADVFQTLSLSTCLPLEADHHLAGCNCHGREMDSETRGLLL